MITNAPENWIKNYPLPQKSDHKYKRGHAVIFGAPSLTGATRLCASACARFAGLTSVVATEESADIYRAALPAHIMVRSSTGEKIESHFTDERITAVIAGCGGGFDDEFFRNIAYRAWEQKHLKGLVLDAEGFKAWSGDMVEEFMAFERIPTIVTPHEGEFNYVFDGRKDVLSGSRAEQAQKAAELLHAIVVLKGAETIIAAVGQETVINKNAPPFLATAGSGDVLAGMIGGLVAQGMPLFDAACAAVWMHGEAANMLGAGLVASDLPEILPKVLQEVLGISAKLG
ncbi:MAG: NAD(P)H-hydrate dehydratase [Alphaproteobacteria bacterium]|nr:NAD(P)H-hydrate dehydratase [Alphaproteobacteria bacterium]